MTWSEVVQSEKRYCRYQFRKGLNPLVFVVSLWQNRQAFQKAEVKHKTITARERLLATELALRWYQSEQGHPPANLEALVTAYLGGVPLDPFSGRPLLYRDQAGTNWLLYSVGPDGVDDGAKRSARLPPAKAICLPIELPLGRR